MERPETTVNHGPRVTKPPSAAPPSRPQPRTDARDPRAPAKLFARDELSNGLGKKLRQQALGGRGSVSPVALRIDGRSRADALAEARALLQGPPVSRDSGHGSTVVRDPPDVNSPGHWDPGSREYKQAAAQVAANAPLEADALQRLSPADRAQYQAVMATLETDPMAQLSVQQLLLTGKLPGEEDLTGQGRLLDHLGALASGDAPLAEGIDREALLASLVTELATPTAISQGPRNTCGPAVVLIELAMKNPAEYARLTLGLASPSGVVKTQSGLELRREPGTDGNDGTRRSLTQRLLAPALMEATKDTPYDNATDEGWGANAEQLDVLREAVLGSERIAHQSGKLATDPAARKLETDMLVNAVKEGDVPVALLMALRPGDPKGEGLHWVLVTGREVRDGVEYLRVVNPWGQEELMTRAELENRMRGQVVEGSCEA
jgi:hypothetical protein